MYFLNKKAKQYHEVLKYVDSPLILLHSEHYNGAVMTQQAYQKVKSGMDACDLATHISTYITADSAARLEVSVLVEDDITF